MIKERVEYFIHFKITSYIILQIYYISYFEYSKNYKATRL